MKNRLIILVCALFSVIFAFADSETDKMISKILRDTNTYISADVRASSEEDAYNQALNELTEKITAYMKETGSEMPETIYLSNISNLSQRLISQSGTNRCRVLVYVKKTDLVPLTDTNSVVLSKNTNDSYTMVQSSSASPAPSAASPSTKSIPPVLTRIAKASTQKQLQELLVNLKKGNEISNAAAFPIANINDFYVVVIDKSDTQVAILHCAAGQWTNALTGEVANMNAYKYCSAYWLTIP